MLSLTQCLHRILDTLQLAMVSHAVYTYAVSDFGNTEALMFPVWYVRTSMFRERMV
jgi:hypothetical protein